jgi:uncharacterized RDD family membrane protein YckC
MSAADTGLVLDSDTGIDVSPQIAGPGARSLAFVMDWHIRVIVAAAWFVTAAVLLNGEVSVRAPSGHGARWFYIVVLPALAIYILYHPVIETALRGRTPGKRRAGIRIVSRNGGPPGVGALLLRNVFRLIDGLPGFYGVGLICVLVTKESVRCGDMAAGTLLVYERTTTDAELLRSASQRTAVLGAVGAEIAADLLQRWDSLAPAARVRLARALLQRFQGATAEVSEADELTWRARVERLAHT